MIPLNYMTFQSSVTRWSMEEYNARASRGPTEMGYLKSKACLCEGLTPAIFRLKWEAKWQNRSNYKKEYGSVTPPASSSLSSLTKQISRWIITCSVGRTGVEGSRKASLKDKHLNCLNQERNSASFPEPPSKIWRPLFPLSIV